MQYLLDGILFQVCHVIVRYCTARGHYKLLKWLVIEDSDIIRYM